ncbi:response regulator [Oscillochloris sp. ZM17-4]|uniref:response regulator n=1 Tax=Oscillochloris sp. ZM17-4 TaxID=2866714 RepID=UPI001C72DEFB|nr:response regulator [Oscillochloris sp. ZM17-4]MBX0327070.1 response regulator [Oscillochloris sp. ZM17-4]
MAPLTQAQPAATQQQLRTSRSDVRGPTLALTCDAPAPIARILISEDNPGIQRIYSRLLPEHGFELVCVPGGDGALTLELARLVLPQLIITDINKPTMDGNALAAALRADPRTARIPLLMVTAMNLRGDSRHAGLAPTDDYIVKPFPFEDLLYRITTMIDLDGPARSELVERAIGLPCYDPHHPATGLPCMHKVASALPARSARPGWAAIELSFANHAALVGAYGRAMVDGLAGQMGAAIRRVAGPNLLVGHTGFDLSVLILGRADAAAAAELLLAERIAGLFHIRAASPSAPAVRLALRRADDRAGLCLSLPELRAALR